MDMLETEPHGVRDYNLERLIMLSDGVFAIAITLLAIDLKAPPHWNGSLASLLDGIGDMLAAYGFSFAVVAVNWVMHRRTFRYLTRSDGALTVLNFVVLGLITLLPFITQLLSERGAHSDALLLYVGLIGAIGVASALQWGWAAFPGKLTRSGLPLGYRIYVFVNLLLIPVTMTVLGALAGQADSRPWSYGLIAVVWGGLIYVRKRAFPGIAD